MTASIPKDEVMNAFGSYKPDLTNTQINGHIVSLMNYGNNPVKSWTKIFAECLNDIGEKNTEEYKTQFQTKSGKSDGDMNEMKKIEFVKLFAETMKGMADQAAAAAAAAKEWQITHDEEVSNGYNSGKFGGKNKNRRRGKSTKNRKLRRNTKKGGRKKRYNNNNNNNNRKTKRRN